MPIVDNVYINACLSDPAEKGVWAAYLAVQDNGTAAAGGGQANGTLINAMTTRVTTVVTIADSMKLPKSSGGLFLTVANAAANSMTVFPQTGEQINSLGANAGFAVAGGKACFFVGTANGQWHTVLSA